MDDRGVISVNLAISLRDAGVTWRPAPGDHFVIPDRDLDDQTFVLSDMIVQVYELPKATVIGFNGTTEWALDDIERDEAIWLPREDQLRDMLGAGFGAPLPAATQVAATRAGRATGSPDRWSRPASR
jgi:hypothetical protein